MSNLFLASEILEMNVMEERNGAAFYTALANNTRNSVLRNAALDIARQEKSHEKRFEQMLEQAERRQPAETYQGEYDAYLQNLLRNKMFADEQDAIATAAGMKERDALEFALRTEQATLNLLHELEKHIDPRELPLVQETIHEEEGHIVQLNQILQQFK